MKRKVIGSLLTVAMLLGLCSFEHTVYAQKEVIQVQTQGGYIPSDLDFNTPIVKKSNVDRNWFQATSIPSSYGKEILTSTSQYPVSRNQNPYGTCWAFSSIGLAEFDAIIDGRADKNVDYSELQLAHFTYNYVQDPLGGTAGDNATFEKIGNGPTYLDIGGNYEMASRRLAQWIGPIPESEVPYSDAATVAANGLDNKYAYGYSQGHLENAYAINIKAQPDEVKKQIMLHGAAGTAYMHNDTALFFNTTIQQYTYYESKTTGGGHAVMVVGWDDNFPKEYFGTEKPTNNGAWLVRNSWGSYYDYFWMSYETTTLTDSAWIFDFNGTNNYDYNYQIDGGIDYATPSVSTMANVFDVNAKTGVEAETLKAISVYTPSANAGYTIKIYTDLESPLDPLSGTYQNSATTTGTIGYAGYHTIPLKQSVVLSPNTQFAVVVIMNNGTIYCEDQRDTIYDETSKLTLDVNYNSGKSLYSSNQGATFGIWDFGDFSIKAFTKKGKEEGSTPSVNPDPETHNCDEHWNNFYTIDVQPTCTQKGAKSIYCSKCGKQKPNSTVEIPAKGHSWKQIAFSGGVTTYQCEECKITKKEGTPWNGLRKASDGQWYLYKNGAVDTGYTGMYQDSSKGWIYIVNGRYQSNYTGMACNEYGWWYFTNGQINWNYTGMAQNEYGWWYYEKGHINFSYTGYGYNEYGCWWYENGQIAWNKTGMICPDGTWRYVKNGQVDLKYTGMACNEWGWWYFTNGQINWNYTGMAQNEYGWWYYEKGHINFSYTGYASNEYGYWWYENGQIAWNKTGMVYGWNIWRYIKNGKVDFGYTGMALNEYGWWYFTNGDLNWNYTGYGYNEYGRWWYENGRLVGRA